MYDYKYVKMLVKNKSSGNPIVGCEGKLENSFLVGMQRGTMSSEGILAISFIA